MGRTGSYVEVKTSVQEEVGILLQGEHQVEQAPGGAVIRALEGELWFLFWLAEKQLGFWCPSIFSEGECSR